MVLSLSLHLIRHDGSSHFLALSLYNARIYEYCDLNIDDDD